jgi:hypothetical protein
MASYRTNIQYSPQPTRSRYSLSGRYFWSLAEDEKLEKAYRDKLDESAIVELFPGRSYAAIRTRAHRQSLRRRRPRWPWTTKEVARLKMAVAEGKFGRALNKLFPNRTPTAVRVKAHKLRTSR